MEGLSERLRFELKPQGIRVKLVEPGPLETGLVTSSLDCCKPKACEPQLRHLSPGLAWPDAKAPDWEGVAKIIFKAAGDQSERLRYSVGSGHWPALQAILPEPIWRSLRYAALNRRTRVSAWGVPDSRA
jgi:NAD(P)-dependent dehydrogenase (short-subunit alcohol dehydrogenase family)